MRGLRPISRACSLGFFSSRSTRPCSRVYSWRRSGCRRPARAAVCASSAVAWASGSVAVTPETDARRPGPPRTSAHSLYDFAAVKELARDLERWHERGEKVALATVVSVRRSAPRPLGSKLAVSESGELAGSVSGGCVEGDVFGQAREVLAGL